MKLLEIICSRNLLLKVIIIVFLTCFSPNVVLAMRNMKELLLYDHKAFVLSCNLLEPIFINKLNEQYFQIKDFPGNKCFCNLASLWEIKEDVLYLRGIDSILWDNDLTKIDLKELFGDKCQEGKVEATWFSGELRFSESENEFSEKDVILEIEAGKVTNKTVIDNPKKENLTENKSTLTPIIDPDKSIFGIPYGITEAEFDAQFGKPSSYIKYSPTETEKSYGKYIFLFLAGRLAGIRETSYLNCDGAIFFSKNNFNQLDWQLSNGITKNMNVGKVKKILGSEYKLEETEYDQHFYLTKKARVEFSSAHNVNLGAHVIGGISVRLNADTKNK